MSRLRTYARWMLAAWFMAALLLPVQTFAARVGAHMTKACHMMPGMTAMHGCRSKQAMSSCHRLQCRHVPGLRTIGLWAALPTPAHFRLADVAFVPALHQPMEDRPMVRGPPFYRQFSRLLI